MTTIDVQRCRAHGCPFFGFPTACSQHQFTVAFQEFCLQTRSNLNADVIRKIGELAKPEHKSGRVAMTEEDILRQMGWNAEEVWEDAAVVEERLFWLQHHDLPFLSCDDTHTALEWLGFNDRKKIKAEDAHRLLTAVEARQPHHYTEIAIQKALVILSLNVGLLDPQRFSVGLCYHGRDPIYYNMKPDAIRSIAQYRRHNLEDGGGGGGGGGGGV